MKLAICLITCGRHDLTRQTIDSLLACNPGLAGRPDVVMLQADEPSMGRDSLNAGIAAGFLPVHQPPVRAAQVDALRHLVDLAQIHDCSHVLWLENDWVSLEPLPWTLLELAGVFDTVRLFGEWKRTDHDHPRARAGQHVLGTKRKIVWNPVRPTRQPAQLFHGWEHGLASWAAGGSIIRIQHLLRHRHQPGLKRMMDAMGPLATLRPTWNIMASIGDQTTPGFMP